MKNQDEAKLMRQLQQLVEQLIKQTKTAKKVERTGSSKRYRRSKRDAVGLKKQAIALRKKGVSVSKIAKQFGVTPAYIYIVTA